VGRPLTEAELLAGDVVWLLQVTYGGHVYRWASDALILEDEDGLPMQFEAGLDVDLEQTFDLLADSTEAVEVEFELVFPVDIAALVAAGHDLSAARGELSLWTPSRTYEQRDVRLEGQIDAPAYGAEGEPIRFSLRDDASLDRSMIPDPAARVTYETWPTHDPACTGRAYPVVFGRPGIYTESDGTAGKTTGSPGLYVALDEGAGLVTILISDGHVVATSVRMINASTGVASNRTVVHTHDGLGRPVSVIVAGDTVVSVGHEIWIRWDNGGGIPSISRAGDYIRGAGELARWLMQQSTRRVDIGRWASVAPLLDRFLVSGYWDDPASASDLLLDHLQPILPISIVSGPDGDSPIVWRTDLTAADVVAELVAGPEFERISDVEYNLTEPINEVRVDFAARGDSAGEFRRSIYVTGDPERRVDADDNVVLVPDLVPSQHARVSRLRYGRRADEPISTYVVTDTDTAILIGITRIMLRGLRGRTVTYDAAPRYATIPLGAWVSLTDEDLSFDGQCAVVLAPAPALGGAMTLALIEDPVRDRRTG
jgi:hypothetical protein